MARVALMTMGVGLLAACGPNVATYSQGITARPDGGGGSGGGGGGSGGGFVESHDAGTAGGSGGGSAGGGSAGGQSAGGGAGGGSGGGVPVGGGTGSGGGPDPLACVPSSPRDCSPGSGTGEADQCVAVTSCFISEVQAAVRRVVNAGYPFIDWSTGTAMVLDDVAFRNAVVDDLNGRGLCAIGDPNAGDEIVVKKDNHYAENFDIIASSGAARYGPLIYTSTCAPAWF